VPYRFRVGIPWRYLPKSSGNFRVMHIRQMYWSECGLWQRIFKIQAAESDTEYAQIDSTIVLVRQQSACFKK
jgi:transposase